MAEPTSGARPRSGEGSETALVGRWAASLGALAAPARLNLLRVLSAGPRAVRDLARALRVPAVNLTYHLAVLRDPGVVQCRKQGRCRVYSIVDGALQKGDRPGWSRLALAGCCLQFPGP